MIGEIGGLATGWSIGAALGAAGWRLYQDMKAKEDMRRMEEYWRKNDAFLASLPRNIQIMPGKDPAGYTDVDYGDGRSATYANDDGSLIWDSVRGCCGKATWLA